MNWPRYRNISARTVSLHHLETFVSDKETLKTVTSTIFLIVVYFLAVHFSLPFANIQEMHRLVAQSEILSAVNAFFTGGALGEMSFLALGVVPLFFFYKSSVKVESGRLKLQPKITLWVLLIVLCLASLFTVWVTVNNIIAPTAFNFVATITCLVLGALLLFQIDKKIGELSGLDIFSLNVLLIGTSYLGKLFFPRQHTDWFVVVLIVSFGLSFIRLIRKVDIVEVSNIQTLKVREGLLPIPATNSLLRTGILNIVLVITLVLVTLLNFFFAANLSAFGDTLPDVILILSVIMGIVLLFTSNDRLHDFFAQFNARNVAKRLRNNYWIIPNVEVGRPTAAFLRHRVAQTQRSTYIFYLLWIFILSTIGILSRLVKLPITPLPFGPLGFIIVLTVCAEIGYGLIRTIARYIERVNFKEFWTTPRSDISRVEEIEVETAYDIQEIVENLLVNLPPEHKKQLIFRLQKLLALEQVTSRDLFLFAIEVIRIYRYASQPVDARFRGIVYKLIISTVLTAAILVFIIWVTEAVGQPIPPNFKAVIVMLAIPIQFSFMAFFGLGQDVKAIFGGPDYGVQNLSKHLNLYPNDKRVEGEFAVLELAPEERVQAISFLFDIGRWATSELSQRWKLARQRGDAKQVISISSPEEETNQQTQNLMQDVVTQYGAEEVKQVFALIGRKRKLILEWKETKVDNEEEANRQMITRATLRLRQQELDEKIANTMAEIEKELKRLGLDVEREEINKN